MIREWPEIGCDSVKIAIVNSSSFGKNFPEHQERLLAYGDVDYFTVPIQISAKELAELLKGYEIVISSVTPFFKREFFELHDDLKLISRHGIGYNNIDIEAATDHGVAVTIVPALVERVAVAENAVAILLSAVRQVVPAAMKVKESKWSSRAKFQGIELTGKTIGVIGFGNIGSRVGEILKNGFDMHLLAYDPYITKEQFERSGAKSVDLETLLKESDFISLNAMVTDESRYMISYHEFSLMKEGVYIVNTARGELFDEDALMQALESNKLGAVAMDVVEGEPIDGNHRLLSYDNVLITPHTSAYTKQCLQEMGDNVVSDVENILNNRTPKELINPEVLK